MGVAYSQDKAAKTSRKHQNSSIACRKNLGHFPINALPRKKVGKDCVITVEEAKSIETSLEVVEGMQFDRGYLSPYFVTDAERMEVEMNDCLILLQEKKIILA